MDLIKHAEFYNPLSYEGAVHVIGLGALGSHVIELLTRLGFMNIYIYDFDTVEDKNLANQMYYNIQIAQSKVTATYMNIIDINPDCKVTPRGKYVDQPLSGIVFLCLDNIDLRRSICTQHQFNQNIKYIFDIRMGLTDAQHYAADWRNPDDVQRMLASMDFTQEDVVKNTPVSACGSTLSIIPTIKVITSLAVSNLINTLKEQPMKHMVLIDAFNFSIISI